MRPIGDWSISITLSQNSRPVIRSCAPAITRVANPTINSYKRLVPGYEAPVYISWSLANRSALVRVPAPRGNSTRAEFRSPDPMCNPYLCFAAMLAAGLDGIRKKIDPPESTDVNIYHLSEKERKARGIEMLPGSLQDATTELNNDPVISAAMGSHIMEGLNSITRMETDLYRTTVHPWEIDRYLATY